MKNNKFKADHVFELDNPNLSRKDKLKQGLEALSYEFDLQMPLWLPDNEKDYEQFGKTQFKDDHFIETIDFDYFEIEIIEDDKP